VVVVGLGVRVVVVGLGVRAIEGSVEVGGR
jgi:hypothetical protein